MKISRRTVITGGLAVTGAATATHMASRHGLIPPDHSGIFGIGETLTYASHRLLTAGGSLAREFDRADISHSAPVNGRLPAGDTWDRLRADDFRDWRLEVDGMVARPTSYSLADLRRFPARTQITHMACEEGWSFIAEWTGAALADLLHDAEVRPEARYVVYLSMDDAWWDSIDMPEALHPQTLLAYRMNGEPLPTGHGAPVRMRVPRQLGYKNVKHLASITVTDTLKDWGSGQGSASPDAGYSWYAGI